MSTASPEMRSLARWLLERETVGGDSPGVDGIDVSRVCERFRGLLSTLMGSAGYVVLLSRALALAKADAPLLGPVRVKPDGALEGLESVDSREGLSDATCPGELLLAHLLDLLVTFIGQSLTLCLVHDLWPDAPFGGTNAESERGS